LPFAAAFLAASTAFLAASVSSSLSSPNKSSISSSLDFLLSLPTYGHLFLISYEKFFNKQNHPNVYG